MNQMNSLSFSETLVSKDGKSKVIKLSIKNLDPANPNVDVEIKISGNMRTKKGFAIFHGATLTYAAMEVFTDRFANNKMIYFNAPGRGLSSEILNPDISQYAGIYSAALRYLIDQGEIDSLAILGYSMGGLIALKTAALKAVKINHIIMLNSTATAKIEPKNEVSRLIHALATGETDTTNPDCLNIIPMHGFGSRTPKEYIDMVAQASVSFLAPLKWAIIDMIHVYKTDFSDQLALLHPDCNILFISGKDDQVVPLANTLKTADELAKIGISAKSVVYEGAGHIDFIRLLDDEDGVKGIASTINDFLVDS
jgi:pimeloyl-ACP methyl ester carboxylesterase